MIDRISRVLHVLPPQPPVTAEEKNTEIEERVEAIIDRVGGLEARVEALELQADGETKKPSDAT